MTFVNSQNPIPSAVIVNRGVLVKAGADFTSVHLDSVARDGAFIAYKVSFGAVFTLVSTRWELMCRTMA